VLCRTRGSRWSGMGRSGGGCWSRASDGSGAPHRPNKAIPSWGPAAGLLPSSCFGRRITPDFKEGDQMEQAPIPRWQVVSGWVLSGILSFVFLPSAFFKIAQPAGFLDEWSKTYPASSALPLGVIEVTLFVLYLVPKTRYLGGLLMLAYLGGAVATHLHAGDGM